MPEQADRPVETSERDRGDVRVVDVIGGSGYRTVVDAHDRSMRVLDRLETHDLSEVQWTEHSARPGDRLARGAVELGLTLRVDHCVVVVATHDRRAAADDEVQTTIGVGAVADDVAETEDLFEAKLVDAFKDSLQGGEVGVNI